MDNKKTVFTENDFKEIGSTSVLENVLISQRLIYPKIFKKDKNNDTDGEIVVLDDNGTTFGELRVQVKTLPCPHRYKIQLSIKFLNYCWNSIPPTLLLAVDSAYSKIFWIYFNREYLEQLNYGNNKTSKTVHLDENQYVTKDKEIYLKAVNEWRNIISETLKRLYIYPEKIEEQYNEIRYLQKIAEKANPLLGISKSDFSNIHQFLDELNGLLDIEFNIIKRRLFPKVWKLGLGFWDYGIDKFSHVLYPIQYDYNDIQIKSLNTSMSEVLNRGFTVHVEPHKNPIEQNSKQYAYHFIERYLSTIMQNRSLEHNVNEILAREFIFAFIDKCNVQLGLSVKDEYPVEELEFALWNYLPWWLKVTMEVLDKQPSFRSKFYGQRAINPEKLVFWIKNKKDEIDRIVKEKLEKERERPIIAIEDGKFSFRIFNEFLLFLKNKGIKKIKRVYAPKDFSRLSQGGACWNELSPEAFEKNVRIFFENLPQAYTNIVSKNFPHLEAELDYYNGANRIVVLFKSKDVYKDITDAPTVRIFFLYKKGTKKRRTIEVYDMDEKPEFKNLLKDNFVEINQQRYELKNWSINHNIVYEDFPLMEYIYEVLKDKLEQYLKSRNPIDEFVEMRQI